MSNRSQAMSGKKKKGLFRISFDFMYQENIEHKQCTENKRTLSHCPQSFTPAMATTMY